MVSRAEARRSTPDTGKHKQRASPRAFRTAGARSGGEGIHRERDGILRKGCNEEEKGEKKPQTKRLLSIQGKMSNSVLCAFETGQVKSRPATACIRDEDECLFGNVCICRRPGFTGRRISCTVRAYQDGGLAAWKYVHTAHKKGSSSVKCTWLKQLAGHCPGHAWKKDVSFKSWQTAGIRGSRSLRASHSDKERGG